MESNTPTENITEVATNVTLNQPEIYSQEELKKLNDFITFIQNNEQRVELVCWGNHSAYTFGY